MAIADHCNIRQNIIVPNISWGMGIHECDVLVCSKLGYLKEYEIKISISDLIKDGRKRHGHTNKKIKELWFAFPDELFHKIVKKFKVIPGPEKDCTGISIPNIPERAGIITFYKTKFSHAGKAYTRTITTIYRKPIKNKLVVQVTEDEKVNMLRLGAMRIWGLKRKIISLTKQLKENDLQKIKKNS